MPFIKPFSTLSNLNKMEDVIPYRAPTDTKMKTTSMTKMTTTKKTNKSKQCNYFLFRRGSHPSLAHFVPICSTRRVGMCSETTAANKKRSVVVKKARLPNPAASYTKPMQYKYPEQIENYRLFSRVRFEKTVNVTEVPSRSDHSRDDIESLWISTQDMQRNKKRNLREFKADGGNWKTCCEEDDFVIANGRLVHPHTFAYHTGGIDDYENAYYCPANNKHRAGGTEEDPFFGFKTLASEAIALLF